MDNVEEIKKRLSITDLIGEYLQLKKVGINYSALCPFHSEKTPSFMVSPERQVFRCFGCGESGDAITFLMKIEGFSFPEALKILGERVGVQVELKPKEQVEREKTKRDLIFQINLLAAKYFKSVLWSPAGKAALDYLLGRGLSRETIEKLKIGYAPPESAQALNRHFARAKISLRDIGLAGNPERFRWRIIFPILNNFSQVIGFSGRILEEILPAGVSAHPKYLNTPETPVFHKSRAIYGINLAKEAIRRQKRVIVAEGQMDVAMSHEAGLEEAVASSGTALTKEHLRVLKRFTSELIIAFDEDEAGQKAADQAVKYALEEDLSVKLTIIEGHKDVGELVRANPKKWPKVAAAALSPVEWLVERAKGEPGEALAVAVKKKLAASALEYIARMSDEIERSHYLSYLAAELAVPAAAVEKALSRVEARIAGAPAEKEAPSREGAEGDMEKRFLSFILFFPEIAGEVKLEKAVNFERKEFTKVYTKALECYNSKGKDRWQKCLDALLKSLSRELAQGLSADSLAWERGLSQDREAAIAEYIALKHRLIRRKNELVKAAFAKEIAEAEKEGDLERVRRLMKELQESLKI